MLHAMHPLPPPHAPHERKLLTLADGWEVRVFAEDDFRHAYFARKRMLHLQLFHRTARVSVLTPSRLTAGRWELCSECTWRQRFAARAELAAALHGRLDLRLPNPVTLAGLEFWFVQVPSGEIETIEIRAFG